jgi:hypothetical protein
MSSQDRANEDQTESVSVPAPAGTARAGAPLTLGALTAGRPDAVLALQRRAGNRAVTRALARRQLQRKKSDPLGHKRISASVGQSSYNLAEDVATVAFLLNKVPSAQGGPTIPLKSDGSVSKEDIAALTAAILQFQQAQKGLSQDGHVDPGEATLGRLNSFDVDFFPISPGDIQFAPDPEPPAVDRSGPRGVNTREHELLKSVYGDHLDIGKIVIVFNAVLGAGSTRTIGNTIDVQGPSMSDHTLIHEAGHAYQYQLGDHYIASSLWAQFQAAIRHGDRGYAYQYEDLVDKKVPFDNWNAEQQAEWIADHRQLPPSRRGEPGYP